MAGAQKGRYETEEPGRHTLTSKEEMKERYNKKEAVKVRKYLRNFIWRPAWFANENT